MLLEISQSSGTVLHGILAIFWKREEHMSDYQRASTREY